MSESASQISASSYKCKCRRMFKCINVSVYACVSVYTCVSVKCDKRLVCKPTQVSISDPRSRIKPDGFIETGSTLFADHASFY